MAGAGGQALGVPSHVIRVTLGTSRSCRSVASILVETWLKHLLRRVASGEHGHLFPPPTLSISSSWIQVHQCSRAPASTSEVPTCPMCPSSFLMILLFMKGSGQIRLNQSSPEAPVLISFLSFFPCLLY